ncbi:DUF1566 domain-containing protein [Candidatus Woesearchaeota archaeon]|nr:DUF1566 domain-containing protein [Candidatus Woesearchaeota archaeon]
MMHAQLDFKKGIVASAIAVATALFPTQSASYSPGAIDGTFCGKVVEKGTHPLLTRKSVELYETLYPQYTFTEEEKLLLEKGAIEEDSPEFCFIRSFNHFTEMGTGKGIWSFPSSQQWGQSAEKQLGDIPFDAMPQGIRQFYQVLVAQKTKGKYPYGDNSWQRVVTEKNLESLGHVLHLLQDATAPAHVRNDAHPGPIWLITLEDFNIHSYVHGDSFESWAEDNSKLALLTPSTITNYKTIDDIFKDVVQKTGENFFSDDTMGNYDAPAVADLAAKKEGKRTYYYHTIEGVEVPIARKSFLTAFMDERKIPHKPHYVLDTKVLEAQWEIQGTRAIEIGAAAIKLYVENVADKCVTHASKVCEGNNVYWQDSCGKLENVFDSCNSNESCVNGMCIEKLSQPFQDLGDGTIKDMINNRIWQKGSVSNKNWTEAVNYCNNLSLGGDNNWELPTTLILLEIINYKGKENCNFYPEFQGNCGMYWTDSKNDPDGCNGSTEVVIHFENNISDYFSCYSINAKMEVRCVKN